MSFTNSSLNLSPSSRPLTSSSTPDVHYTCSKLLLPEVILNAKKSPLGLISANGQTSILKSRVQEAVQWAGSHNSYSAFQEMRSLAQSKTFNAHLANKIISEKKLVGQAQKDFLEQPLGRFSLYALLKTNGHNSGIIERLYRALSLTIGCFTSGSALGFACQATQDTLNDVLKSMLLYRLEPEFQSLLQESVFSLLEALILAPGILAEKKRAVQSNDGVTLPAPDSGPAMTLILVALVNFAGIEKVQDASFSVQQKQLLAHMSELSLDFEYPARQNQVPEAQVQAEQAQQKPNNLTTAEILLECIAGVEQRYAVWCLAFAEQPAPATVQGQKIFQQIQRSMDANFQLVREKLRVVLPLAASLTQVQFFHLFIEFENLSPDELKKLLSFSQHFSARALQDDDFRCLAPLTQDQQMTFLTQMFEVCQDFFVKHQFKLHDITDSQPIVQALLQEVMSQPVSADTHWPQQNLLHWLVYESLKNTRLSSEQAACETDLLDSKIQVLSPVDSIDTLALLDVFRTYLSLNIKDRAAI